MKRSPHPSHNTLQTFGPLLLLALAYLPGCSQGGASTTAELVVVLAVDGDPRTDVIGHTLLDEANVRGISIDIMRCKTAREQRRILGGIEARADLRAVLLQPLTQDGWEASFARLRERGISILLLDRGVSDTTTAYATRIGGDPYDQGRLAARHIQQIFPEGACIVELQSRFDAGPRSRALADAVERSRRFTITERRVADDDLSWLAERLAEDAQPVDVIFTHNPQVVARLYEIFRQSEKQRRQRAKEAAQKAGSKDTPIQPRRYKVVAIGGDGTTLVGVIDRRIDAVIDTPATQVGELVFPALDQLARRAPLDRDTIVPSLLIDPKTALQLLSRGRQ